MAGWPGAKFCPWFWHWKLTLTESAVKNAAAPVPSAADVCPSKQWTVVVSHVDYLGVTLHIQQNGVDILTDGPNDFHTTP